MSYFDRFQSTLNVATDPELVNRIEQAFVGRIISEVNDVERGLCDILVELGLLRLDVIGVKKPGRGDELFARAAYFLTAKAKIIRSKQRIKLLVAQHDHDPEDKPRRAEIGTLGLAKYVPENTDNQCSVELDNGCWVFLTWAEVATELEIISEQNSTGTA